MKKLAVFCNVAVMVILLMLCGCQTTDGNTSAYSGPTVSGELPAGWQKTNNIELEHLIGTHLPIPTYLPSGYEIKEVYYTHEPSDSPPSTNILFLISDRQVEWVDSQYTCQLALSLDWNNAGLGLKMPWAEYIPEIRGRLEDKESEYTLWWETYGSPKSLGSTLRLHASNQFPKEELIKIADSTPSSNPSSEVTSPSTGWTTFTTEDGLADNIVTSVIQDKQGILWVGSTEGLTRYDGSRFEIYTDSLVDTHIICTARDSQGNLWFGTSREGAYEYTGTGWQHFNPGNTGNGLPGVQINAILVDNQDNIWFATTGNVGQRTAPIDYGVTRYDGSDWKTFLGRTRVTTIFQDNQGNLWFGTNDGVTCYDGAYWETFTTEDGPADNYVVAITQDTQGNMWFGTWNDGTSRYDGKEWRTFYSEDGLMSDAIHCMLKDSRGNLWFGSYCINGYYGISRFDGAQWQHFDPWPETNTYNVLSIFEDNEGNIWFATSIGLVRYSPGAETEVVPAPASQLPFPISREQAIKKASDTLSSSIVDRAEISAELHGWYWEVDFDNLDAEADELMPWPLKGPPPPPPGEPTREPYPGIWQTVIITVDAWTGDIRSGGARQEPSPGPYTSREQAISNAREYITAAISEAWIENAMVEAYLRGDTWIVLFWEEGASAKDSKTLDVHRFRVSVDAVTGEATGLSRG